MKAPERLDTIHFIESDNISMPSTFTGPVEGVTLSIDPMLTDKGQHGEFIEAWLTDESDPWHVNVQTYFIAGGFRAVMQPPYNEDDSDSNKGVLARPDNITGQRVQFTRENDGGISAQERHLVVSGLVRVFIDHARSAYVPKL